MKLFAVATLGILTLTGCVTVNLPEIPPYHPGYAQAETGALAPAPPILDLNTAPPTASPSLPVPAPSDLEPGTIRSDQMGKTPMSGNIHQEHGTMQHMEHGQMDGQAQGGMQGEMKQHQNMEKNEEDPSHEGMQHEGQAVTPQAGSGHQAEQGQTHPDHKTDEPKAVGSGDNKPIYTCPMHPEVVSDRPGTCPKCGMTLQKKEVKK